MLRNSLEPNTQGKTLDEAKANLIEAIQLVLQANRELAAGQLSVGNCDVRGMQ